MEGVVFFVSSGLLLGLKIKKKATSVSSMPIIFKVDKLSLNIQTPNKMGINIDMRLATAVSVTPARLVDMANSVKPVANNPPVIMAMGSPLISSICEMVISPLYCQYPKQVAKA